jgi:hypothetical protein
MLPLLSSPDQEVSTRNFMKPDHLQLMQHVWFVYLNKCHSIVNIFTVLTETI